MRKGFFAFYALVILLGMGSLIGFWYESKGRIVEIKNSQHFYTQMQLYEQSLLSLSKVCLQKYGIQLCSFLHFSFGEYDSKIEMKQIGEKEIQIDILIELIHPLHGGIIRNNSRNFLCLDNL